MVPGGEPASPSTQASPHQAPPVEAEDGVRDNDGACDARGLKVEVRAAITGASLLRITLPRGLIEELRAFLVQAGVDNGLKDYTLICGGQILPEAGPFQQEGSSGRLAVDLIWGEQRRRTRRHLSPASGASSGSWSAARSGSETSTPRLGGTC
mmetsp:Transcript_23683/g.70483  ORF Transcript_23683/g.70483 Transcript_23683/m.70483 type:complete len:153 (-) Transcript_23683:190-648(-)